jgi:hypothetical protein
VVASANLGAVRGWKGRQEGRGIRAACISQTGASEGERGVGVKRAEISCKKPVCGRCKSRRGGRGGWLARLQAKAREIGGAEGGAEASSCDFMPMRAGSTARTMISGGGGYGPLVVTQGKEVPGGMSTTADTNG